MDPATEGVWDLYRVKKQMINSATVIAEQVRLLDGVASTCSDLCHLFQLLLVDEILKASKTGKEPAPQE
jgi:hypothetical protein